MSATTPNLNQTPNDRGGLWQALSAALRSFEQESDQLLPATVVKFDRVANQAIVRPIIQMVDIKGKVISRKPVASVPVLSLGAGGFHISFPMQPGDLGWIFASDRDLALFKKNLSESPPNTSRFHKFDDGFFIPDVFRKYMIAAEDAAAMVIQSTDGSTKISIRDGDILIAAPNKLVVRVPESEFDGNVTIKENLIVTGQTTVNGGFDASSSSGNAPCALPQSTTINNILVAGHGHEQQGTSGRTAGGMEP